MNLNPFFSLVASLVAIVQAFSGNYPASIAWSLIAIDFTLYTLFKK